MWTWSMMITRAMTVNSGQARRIKRWRTKQGVVQLKAPVVMDQAEPNPGDPYYAEVLRDV